MARIGMNRFLQQISGGKPVMRAQLRKSAERAASRQSGSSGLSGPQFAFIDRDVF